MDRKRYEHQIKAGMPDLSAYNMAERNAGGYCTPYIDLPYRLVVNRFKLSIYQKCLRLEKDIKELTEEDIKDARYSIELKRALSELLAEIYWIPLRLWDENNPKEATEEQRRICLAQATKAKAEYVKKHTFDGVFHDDWWPQVASWGDSKEFERKKKEEKPELKKESDGIDYEKLADLVVKKLKDGS
jgi:hypothetical protein